MTQHLPSLPAVCGNCGKIFPSGFGLGGGPVLMVGCTSKCPSCGGVASIPDGLYGALSATALAHSGGTVSIADFQQLLAILRESLETRSEPEEVSAQIQDTVPVLKAVGDALPKTNTELYAVLAILISLLGLILNSCSGDRMNQISDDALDALIQRAISDSYNDPHQGGE